MSDPALNSRSFFHLFDKIFPLYVKAISSKETIGEIESFLKDYSEHCYCLLKSPPITLEEYKRYFAYDKINKVSKFIESIVNANILGKYDDIVGSAHYKYVHVIQLQITILVLLTKKGYIPDISKNNKSFLIQFLLSILKITPTDGDDSSSIKNILNKTLSKYVEHINNITSYSRELSIYLWGKFDNIKIAEESHLQNIVKSNDLQLTLHTLAPGSYYNYFRSLDNVLENIFDAPDVIMLDSTLISEYRSKGLIHSLSAKLAKQSSIKSMSYDVLHLGKSLHDTLGAYPLSRNYHSPAMSSNDLACFKESKIDFHNISVQNIENLSNQQLSKYIGVKIHYNDFVRNDGLNRAKRLYTDETLLKAEEDHIEIPFVNEPIQSEFIPMQLAKGAHCVYTLFAYFANISKDCHSLIEIEVDSSSVNPKLKLPDTNHLLKRLKLFYCLLYTNVPVNSLVLDHVLSGWIRDNSENWFDFCLPIESVYFQDNSIQFAQKPAYTYDENKFLSCLGGFCLAITRDCKQPEKAADAITELANKRFRKFIDCQSISHDSKSEFINTFIIPDKDTDHSITDGYSRLNLSPPILLSIRPQLPEWTELETLISDVFRVNITALFLFRQIIISYSDNLNALIKDIGNNVFNEQTLKLFLQNSVVLINKKLNPEDHAEKRKIIEFNLSFSPMEKVYILSLTKQLLMIIKKRENGCTLKSLLHESFNMLAKATIHEFHSKLKSFSYNKYSFE